MNQIKRNLVGVLLFSLIFILSSCESPEDKVMREASAVADKSLREINKRMDDSIANLVALNCKDSCNSWGKFHLSEDEEINTCIRWCVERCGNTNDLRGKCVDDFVKGMGVSQDRETKIEAVKEECRKRGLSFPC